MLNQTEMKVFLDICKEVRKEQDYRKNYNELYAGCAKQRKTSAFIHVVMTTAWSHMDMKINQYYAIAFKLQEKGLVKVHEGNGRKKTTIQLTPDAMKLVKQLKERRK